MRLTMRHTTMNILVIKHIAIAILVGVILQVEGGSIKRKYSKEVILMPPDITNEALQRDNTMKRVIDRIPEQHLQCLTGESILCTKFMAEIKRTLKKAMMNECATCSDKEKASAGYVLASLIYFHPEEWRRMLRRYNALDKYEQRYIRGPTSTMGYSSKRHRRDFEHPSAVIPLPDSLPLRTKPVFKSYLEGFQSGPYLSTHPDYRV